MVNNQIRCKIGLSLILILILSMTNAFAQDEPEIPDVHPRLFITPDDILSLQNKITDVEFQGLWGQITGLSNSHFLSAALLYLLTADTTKGEWAVDNALSALINKPSESDAINKSSNIMNRAACVYDWCYDLLDESQKESFVTEFIRLAGTEAPGYPADYSPYSVIVGHIAESNVQLSQLLAGCAIFDEDPTMWNAAFALHWDKFIPARNQLYPMHMYWQGDSYFGRFINDAYNAWFYRILGFGDVYVADMQYVPYGFIYSTRPDGRQFKRGDRYDEKGNAGKKGPICRTLAMYWDNPYLTTIADNSWYAYYASSNDGSHDMEKVFEFILRPPNLNSAPLTDLALTKYFPEPMGEMIARTGWDWLDEESNDAVINMEMGGCDFKGHTNPGHFGGFQIYYKGILAVSTGCYQNKTAHDNNYHEKSQSHNVLLILDPNEDTSYGSSGTNTANDGGQVCQPPNGTYETKPIDYDDLLERFRKVNIIAQQFGPDTLTPDYSYISGDLTPAYSNLPTPKVSEVKRSMAMINHFNEDYPASFVIFDRVVSTNPDFLKTWQIHCIEEPSIDNTRTIIQRTSSHYPNGPSGGSGHYSGKLVVNTLLPLNASIQGVGGTGFDCWVGFEGQNYPPDQHAANYDYENGMWRVEVSPSIAQNEDLFLHSMTLMDDDIVDYPLVELIETDSLIGATVLDRMVCFSKNGKELTGPLSLTIPESEEAQVLVTDLEPGIWNVVQNSTTIHSEFASEEGGCIYFPASGGEYLLSRAPAGISNSEQQLISFVLHQNYPNPFNTNTIISYKLLNQSAVKVYIYNISGQLVDVLVNDIQSTGDHKVMWDASGLSAGVYIYRLEAGFYSQVKKMILIK